MIDFDVHTDDWDLPGRRELRSPLSNPAFLQLYKYAKARPKIGTAMAM